MEEAALDNPVWQALTSLHASFAQGTGRVKRYRQGIVPFVACQAPAADRMDALNPWMQPGESVYIIGDLPALPPGWTVENELPCAQMLLETPSLKENTPAAVTLLEDADAAAMYELINSVQPGYYNVDTRLLGVYYGIKENGKLVAMAGERMRFTGYTELSAICTHPGYTGRGLAQQLITALCRRHMDAGTSSFLHVALSNQRAIRLYEHIGFVKRREISFRRVKKLA
jgi:ribosomal protein S18 acetylase RimI-like enzyme